MGKEERACELYSWARIFMDERQYIKARHIQKVKLGQELKVLDTGIEEWGEKAIRRVTKWVVTEIYPFFVRARRRNYKGQIETRCFSLGELVQMGYEPTGGMEQ